MDEHLGLPEIGELLNGREFAWPVAPLIAAFATPKNAPRVMVLWTLFTTHPRIVGLVVHAFKSQLANVEPARDAAEFSVAVLQGENLRTRFVLSSPTVPSTIDRSTRVVKSP